MNAAFLTVMLAAALLPARLDAPQRGRPPVFFVVTTIAPNGHRQSSSSGFWNGAEHLDTVQVWLADEAPRARMDSVRVFVKSGPVSSADPQKEYADVARADSLGRWTRLPATFLTHPATSPDRPMAVASFSARSAVSWARRNVHARPFATRVAVEVWRGVRSSRAELRLEVPE